MDAFLPILLLFDGALFFIAFALGITHARRRPADADTAAPGVMGPTASLLVALGAALALGILLTRAARSHSFALPLSDHLDAFCLLALLLAAAAAYFRLTRRFRLLALFLFPMIGALLLLGGMLATLAPAPYNYASAWTLLHIVFVIAGTVSLAIACVGGAVYLLAHRQLKPGSHAVQPPVRGLPPLAAIERFNFLTVYAGFALLTLAMITGFLRLAQGGPATAPAAGHLSPKILLASAAWITYALVAHAPLAPRLRGLHVAWLSILGFALFLATYAAVTWM